ncbi:uncharacterized protein I303_101217 [Kwoniella dejecticola CBS 10117]|uniref:S1-like domain-containing protein n=1 Tax=Kwoniella dejecticola CBS 10117 TaxID=1296121 RepID=A0A1A6AH55_9TREE|nr:uncharacterized protein I303_01223 [Kwoniella dejecticola CBS 10117]OBR89396.1 hypothetical protein I303_01223 [Kwoniella dejecticola CBS 10117]
MPRRPPSPPSFTPPLPANQYLVHLQSPQGSNNWLCKDTDGVERLVEASSKLRRIKTLIIMRGDFAIINLFPVAPEDKAKGGRLVGEIVHILDKSDIKEWKKAGAWPEGFGEQPQAATSAQPQSDDEDEAESEEESDDGAQQEDEEKGL